MQEQQKQLAERLKQAQNILVTVTANPSVDQLSAAIGLTLVLNHLGKHGTAVFSGQVPNTLEFLKPEDTLEKNTDSLRDFIIALDKSKADKLRYKVEDDVVRIFITPYKTSISQKDLEFSQGDFNVDVVVAIGVRQQQDLDTAITAHGRILHDATVASINTEAGGELGSINWLDTTASSLSEMVASLVEVLDKKVLDSQIATALLTGIVATTERFRNDKTTPKTMSVSAALMAAGANQQLVATQLETPPPAPEAPAEPDFELPQPDAFTDEEKEDQPNDTEPTPEKPKAEPGTLEIEHDEQSESEEEHESPFSVPAEPIQSEPEQPQVEVDDDGHLILPSEKPAVEISTVRRVPGEPSGDMTAAPAPENDQDDVTDTFGRIMEPPARGGDLTAAAEDEDSESASEELTLPSLNTPLMNHGGQQFSPTPEVPTSAPSEPVQPSFAAPSPTPTPSVAPGTPPFFSTPPVFTAPDAHDGIFTAPNGPQSQLPPINPDETLAEIEQSVGSRHLSESNAAASAEEEARKNVDAAFLGAPEPFKPAAATGAQTVFDQAEQQFDTANPTPTNQGFSEPVPGNTPSDVSLDMPTLNMPLPPQQAPFVQPTNLFQAPSQGPSDSTNQPPNPDAPPPVPPPMVPRPQ